MGNSSTKLAEKCSLLSKDEVPLVASSFKLVSKNSERIKEDDLMVSYNEFLLNESKFKKKNCFDFRNFGDHKWIRV